MTRPTGRVKAELVAVLIALAVPTAIAGVDVKSDYDKTFNFGAVRTWGWNPDGPGQVKMARTQQDDPEAMRARAEPLIIEAVTGEMNRRGLQAAPSAPDLVVTYYLLLSTNMTSQTVGQFLPATTQWGLPPFAPATQSLEMMNHGSLVLDVTAGGRGVWRGVANAKLKTDTDDKRREALLKEAVRDLFRRFPAK